MRLKGRAKTDLRGLLRQVCLARDRACLKCGRYDRLQTSHIYPKGRYRKMEWDHLNCIILCCQCHMHWWHKHPIEAADWIRSVLPASRMEYLKMRSLVNDSTPTDYKLIEIEYNQLLRKYA